MDTSNFWANPIASSAPAPTLEDLERGWANLQAREEAFRRDGPLHLIRGHEWCDVCGHKSGGSWQHGDS